jgi:hypothetical protein
LGTANATSPAGVDNTLGRLPLRQFDRCPVRSWRPAPITRGQLRLDQLLHRCATRRANVVWWDWSSNPASTSASAASSVWAIVWHLQCELAASLLGIPGCGVLTAAKIVG